MTALGIVMDNCLFHLTSCCTVVKLIIIIIIIIIMAIVINNKTIRNFLLMINKIVADSITSMRGRSLETSLQVAPSAV